MELVNDFTVQTPIDEAWTVLTDVERIAPCLPGAQLLEVEGDVYRGVVKVKVGPITAQFKGEATFVDKDAGTHRAVLHATGRDTTGKGNADATITAQLESVGAESTKVTVTTDLNITGKVAQFGRGALADVSTKLLHQFVDQLETTVLAEHKAPAAAPAAPAAPKRAKATTTAAPAPAAAPAPVAAAETEAPVVRKIEHREAVPVDLVETAGGAVAKRLLPLLGVLVVIWLWRRGRRRRARRA